ncbi:MAG TPA: peptidogalycan biosysnthesis protein [Polyangia bacterium]|jgi:predicted N-acyltransferase|nr:peptidogalycan biosysnthesis protein [Polyangia bacterium]
MECVVYRSIEDLGPEKLAGLAHVESSPVDFSYGLLAAMERSLWGDLAVCYVAIEDAGTLCGFVPVYVGTNIAFTAALPRLFHRLYPALVEHFGLRRAYRVAVAGSLISDRGFLPLRPGCDEARVVEGLIRGIEDVARAERVHLCFVKDVHQDFPARARFREAGFTECYSLPTVRVNTGFASVEDYIRSLSPNSRSHCRRTMRKMAAGGYALRAVDDYAHLVPAVYPLFRATYLKARFQLEELPPGFFVECARATTPRSELLVCEKEGRIVGSYLVLFEGGQQLNKRIGIDYRSPDSALIYCALNYYCLRRAIERDVTVSYLGQTTYTPKVRMGGQLEDQFLYIKGYDLGVRLSLPLQKLWMARFRAARVRQEMEREARRAEAR